MGVGILENGSSKLELMYCCPQESREQALESQVEEARRSCLQGALEEAQKMIQDALAQIDDPVHISCTSSAGKTRSCSLMDAFSSFVLSPCLSGTPADYLASRCQASLDAVEQLRKSREAFAADNSGESTVGRVQL